MQTSAHMSTAMSTSQKMLPNFSDTVMFIPFSQASKQLAEETGYRADFERLGRFPTAW